MSGVPRSQPLIWMHFAAAGFSGIWTCPADHVTLVKSLYVENTNATEALLALSTQGKSGAVVLNVAQIHVPANAGASWQGWLALGPGDVLYTYSYEANVSVVVSGSVLFGAPTYPPAFRELPSQKPDC